MTLRPIKRMSQAVPTLEGAGVHLRRAFGFGKTADFDPFLLLDDFRNDDPEDYLAGLPLAPAPGHRDHYLCAGRAASITATAWATAGSSGPGDVQWMTAGSGIIHQEMPKGDDAGRMHGFQLWANLPASHKMTAPRYQDVPGSGDPRGHGRRRDTSPRGVRQTVGRDGSGGRHRRGPGVPGRLRAAGHHQDPAGGDETACLRLRVCRLGEVLQRLRSSGGSHGRPGWWTDGAPPAEARNRSLVLFDRGDEVRVQTEDEGVRFLLVSGEPLREPVAWYGPIVMNTQEELRQAFQELQRGTFLRSG